jgi:hypothetical protein
VTIAITVNGAAYPVPSSAADTNWAAQQIAFEQALAAALAAPTWIPIAGENSWVSDGSMPSAGAYYKDSAGTVRFRFSIQAGVLATRAFTLPSGYRPAYDMSWPCANPGFGLAIAQIAASSGFVTIVEGVNADPSSTICLTCSFSTVANP